MSKDYYEVLGIEKTASQEEIKRAFRKKAAQLHPDRNKDPKAPDEFKKVNEAYQVLSDEAKRKRYDQFGAAGVEQGSFGGGQGFEFDFSDVFSGGFESVFGDENPFGDIFGGRRQKSNKGQDISIAVSVTLAEVISGPEQAISYSRREKCKTCNGIGGKDLETCKACNGAGRVSQVTRSMFGNIQVMRECAECHGSGKKPKDICTTCKGDGTVQSKRSFKIRIPKGIESGMNLRFTEEGNAGQHGAEYGDLYVQIDVKPDPHYIRHGDNLHRYLQCSVLDLILGEKVEIDTFDGKKQISIPAGTDIEEKLILKELGVPNIRTKKRGDIVLSMKVAVPKSLSKEEVELYKKLKEKEVRKQGNFWKK